MDGKQAMYVIKFPGFVMECIVRPEQDWNEYE